MRGRPAAELTSASHRLVVLSRVWAPLMSFRHSHHLSVDHECMPRQTNGPTSGVCTFSPSRRPPRRNASFQRLDKSFPSPRSLGQEAFQLSLVRKGQASHITSVKCKEYTCMRLSLEATRCRSSKCRGSGTGLAPVEFLYTSYGMEDSPRFHRVALKNFSVAR